jgi:hypothetical protein
MRVLVCCILGVLSSVASAVANPIVAYEFAGEVASASAFMPSLPIGTQVRFTVPFDFAAPDTCALPGGGFYSFPGSMVSFNGVSYSSSWTALEVNTPDGNCVPALTGLTLRLLTFAGPPFFSATLDFGSLSSADGKIPELPLGFEVGFSLNYVGHGFGGPAAATGSARLARIVPEPSLLLLMASGVAAIAARRPRGLHSRKPDR